LTGDTDVRETGAVGVVPGEGRVGGVWLREVEGVERVEVLVLSVRDAARLPVR